MSKGASNEVGDGCTNVIEEEPVFPDNEDNDNTGTKYNNNNDDNNNNNNNNNNSNNNISSIPHDK